MQSTQSEWQAALEALPPTPAKIPAFFFGHGSPFLAFPPGEIRAGMGAYSGPTGPLANFLKDFGPALLTKYKPQGIVVFSAHWETRGERLITDYGNENPLLMDYYGFQPIMYDLKFKSKGDSVLSQRVVQLFKEGGQAARTTSKEEPRGQDGRGFSGPGLDHGVFIPFRLMFGEEFMDIPVVQVSIDSNLSPESNWSIGKAIEKLREERILILSGGLTVHNLRDMASFAPTTAMPVYIEFNDAIMAAIAVPDPKERKQVMMDLTKHAGFRVAHPREDHFIPLYVSAGAGEGGDVRIIANLYGAQTIAFGV